VVGRRGHIPLHKSVQTADGGHPAKFQFHDCPRLLPLLLLLRRRAVSRGNAVSGYERQTPLIGSAAERGCGNSSVCLLIEHTVHAEMIVG